jgi:hypothetical protein
MGYGFSGPKTNWFFDAKTPKESEKWAPNAEFRAWKRGIGNPDSERHSLSL